MKATIYPYAKDDAVASVTIPPSKSVSHRAIICACLANGTSHINNIAYSDDIRATIDGMRKLGAVITQHADHLTIIGCNFGGGNATVGGNIDCMESGSTLRFFIPLFSLTGRKITFVGTKRLMERPQSVYENIFATQGLQFCLHENALTINGSIKAGEYTVNGDISSQFITGLLFALSMLKGNSVIHITPPFESRSYVDLTLQAMSDFGVIAEFTDPYTIKISGGQEYKPRDYRVEGDYSQFAFFGVLGAISHDITCYGVRHNSLQGDKIIIDILRQLGAVVSEVENGYSVHKSKLNATDIDLVDCPDLGPILTVLAMYANGKTTIYNAQRLRFKESDRIDAMQTELQKLGVDITSAQDTITINGKTSSDKTLHDEHGFHYLCSHNDHRIVMSIAIAAAGYTDAITISGAENINKSYPNFFDDLQQAGIRVELQMD